MNGHGNYWFPNGNRYEGEWKNGLMHGFGVMYYKTGETYEGEWKDGLEDGKGSLVRLELDGQNRYEGEFKSGKKEGKVNKFIYSINIQGILRWPNGDQYIGEFTNDKMDGEGRLVCTNGNTYVGMWRNNFVRNKNNLI